MKNILSIFATLLCCLSALAQPLIPQIVQPLERQYPNVYLAVNTNPIVSFEGSVDDDLLDVMVPVPMKDRVFNKTGIQCVWASTELLGRYAEEPKLVGLTNLPDCKSYASPASAAAKLKQLKVRFEQTTSKSGLIITETNTKDRPCIGTVIAV